MALSSSSLTSLSTSTSSSSLTSSTSTTTRSFYSLFDDNNSPENIPNNNELELVNDSVLNSFRFESQEHLQPQAVAVSAAFDYIFELGNDKNDNNFNIAMDPNATKIKRRRLNIHHNQPQLQPLAQSQRNIFSDDSNGLNVDNFISDNLSSFQHPMTELFPNGNFDFPFDNKISLNHSHNNRPDPGNISSPDHVLSPDSISSINNRFGFQYVLRAATSEAVKVTEDALTYLNQGQNYEIKFNRFGDLSQFCGRTFKSIIRLSFYEKRLQQSEKLKFQCWQQTRTNDRILEVDTNLSYGLKDIKQFSDQTNIVECTWDGTLSAKDLGLFIRINCISTEFTARKSGGEKGVPFRLQIETFAANERIGVAVCQIKVFKMKGADRKQKQDRKKFLKRTFEDRQRFQKSADSTVLIEANNDDDYHAIDYRYENSDEGDLQPIVSSTKLLSETGNNSSDFRIENGIGFLDQNCPEVLQNWLQINRFRTVSDCFVNFTLTDMFGLSRHDFIDLCGKYEGIRLFNTLRKRPNQIVLKIYIEKSKKLYEPIYLETLQVSEFRRKLLQMIAYANDGCEFTEMFVLGPNNIKVILTDDMLAHLSDDSVFDVSIVDTAIFLKQVY